MESPGTRQGPKTRLHRIIEMLDLSPEAEVGKDDFIFGNMIEFPPARELDSSQFPELLAEFSIDLPVDSKLDENFLENLLSKADLDDAGRSLLLRVLEGSEIDWGSDEMFDLVDHLLPGTLYDTDLPSDLSYWQPDDELYFDSEAEMLRLFQEQPVAVSALLSELASIKESFQKSQDTVVKKSLILACFSLVESYTRQRIMVNVPVLSASPELNKYIESLLEQETRTEQRRAKLISVLEPNKKWKEQIPFWQLRNALAHDFGSVHLAASEISYQSKSKKIEEITETEFFSSLVDYVETNLAE